MESTYDEGWWIGLGAGAVPDGVGPGHRLGPSSLLRHQAVHDLPSSELMRLLGRQRNVETRLYFVEAPLEPEPALAPREMSEVLKTSLHQDWQHQKLMTATRTLSRRERRGMMPSGGAVGSPRAGSVCIGAIARLPCISESGGGAAAAADESDDLASLITGVVPLMARYQLRGARARQKPKNVCGAEGVAGRDPWAATLGFPDVTCISSLDPFA